jgi:hypothetical protein
MGIYPYLAGVSVRFFFIVLDAVVSSNVQGELFNAPLLIHAV